MRRGIIWAGWVASGICAAAMLGLIIGMAVSFTWPLLVGVLFMAVLTLIFGLASGDAMMKLDKSESVFGNTAEDEILSSKQRKTLRAARAEVLMELAMLDVEKEKENIAHRQLMEAGDMTLPPHKTSFTNPDGSPKQIGRRDYR